MTNFKIVERLAEVQIVLITGEDEKIGSYAILKPNGWLDSRRFETVTDACIAAEKMDEKPAKRTGYVIRFGITKSSTQYERGYRRTYLRRNPASRKYNMLLINAQNEYVPAGKAQADVFLTYDEALEELITYMRHSRWSSGKMWVKNPKIVQL